MRNNGKLKKLNKMLRKVKRYKDQMAALSENELRGLTAQFKERLAKGESLDSLIPEAFAAMAEADYRILGKFPYDVQILGGLALHYGYLAEMNTGEGKTLTATMPLYLNALTGKGTILVTTNEYLALRDAEEMGLAYEFMELSCMPGVTEKPTDKLETEDKKLIYNSDIVYTTHSALGFDYLINNLVTSADERFLREFNYVIIDEADSVLLDTAQTPLVISGTPRVQSNLYNVTDFFVTSLKEDVDYECEDEKSVWLTSEGIERAENFFGIDNFYAKEYFEINRHVILALRAHKLFQKDKEYVVTDDGEVVLIDGSSGRAMKGVKLGGGQHQALEMKEHVEITQENRAMASITYQNLFGLFKKMSGMSGTISDASSEILDIYNTEVVVIPPNHKVMRRDMPDMYFRDAESQINAAVEEIKRIHATHQPVLVVVSKIAETEIVSRFLIESNIPHNVLNANNVFWEAAIIAEAGVLDAVTVATSIVGRGTDIKLGEGVRELGGLAVIGIGRMANVRQERQARGRAGRQGDPGYSRFFVSLEDDIIAKTGNEKVEKILGKGKRVSKRTIKKYVDGAQHLSEEMAEMSRKSSTDYDQVLQKQRTIMYETRDKLLDGNINMYDTIMDVLGRNINRLLDNGKKSDSIDPQIVDSYILDNISYKLPDGTSKWSSSKRAVKTNLIDLAKKVLARQEQILGSRDNLERFLRVVALRAIDGAWVEQVDYLKQLQAAVSGRATAQKNLVFEYQRESSISYKDMEENVLTNMVRNAMLSSASIDDEDKLSIVLP